MEENMKKLFAFIPIFLFFAGICSGTAIAQERMSLVGTWVGPAEIAMNDSFSTAQMTLVVTEQEGRAFHGTIGYDEGTPFPVSGIFYGDKIRLTGTVSTFTGEIWFIGLNKVIVGSGSKLASENVGEMTVGFQLYWAGYGSNP